MIERGKYQSLTMINWNGFFARTFDIDNLVTTLSGGNGAGKSTTMAAFITALIPDQSLLHFRNTTEAGTRKPRVIKVCTVSCKRVLVTRRWMW